MKVERSPATPPRAHMGGPGLNEIFGREDDLPALCAVSGSILPIICIAVPVS
jgi:hypothetical protein